MHTNPCSDFTLPVRANARSTQAAEISGQWLPGIARYASRSRVWQLWPMGSVVAQYSVVFRGGFARYIGHWTFVIAQ